MRNFITSTVAGFLFNLPLMSSVIIVYEKVSCLYTAIQKLLIILSLFVIVFIKFGRVLKLYGTDHNFTIDSLNCRSTDIIHSRSRLSREGMLSLASRLSWISFPGYHCHDLPIGYFVSPSTLHRIV